LRFAARITTPPLAALLALALGLALLVALPGAADAQEAGFDLRLEPATSGNTAARGGQQVRLSGTGPAGDISDVRIIAIDANQQRYVQLVGEATRNRGPAGPGEERRDYVRNRDGQIDGELTLGCLFNDPAVSVGPESCRAAAPVRLAVVELVVGGQTGESDAVRIDYTRPLIRGYEHIARDQVRVVFSEPVRLPGTLQDSAADWKVEGSTVTEVRGPTQGDCQGRYAPGEDATAGATGCTRTLVLLQPVDEDARPFTEYEFLTARGRQSYVDFASNVLLQAVPGTFSRAADLIRPRIPRIESIDGKAPSGETPRVRSNDRQPTIRVSNARQGHRGFFLITRPNGDTFDTSASPFTFGSGAFETSLPTLGGSTGDDGEYRVEVVAIDPNGNRSDEADKNGPGGDGSPNPVVYDLLTSRPRIEQAFQTGARTVSAVLNRAVAPAGQAGSWTVDGRPATAEGEGLQRTIRTSVDLTPTSVLAWEPSSSTYRDAHGNELLPFSLPVSTLPLPLPPTVTAPANEVFQRASTVTVAGQALSGLTVELYDDGASSPRATTTSSGGTWSFEVSLPQDARYRFEVATRRPDTDLRSTRTAVPAVIRDTRVPNVDVHEPSLEPLLGLPLSAGGSPREFAVGDPVRVEWTASDPAQRDPELSDHGDRVDVALTVGGQRRVVGANRPYQPGERTSFSYTLTEADRQAQADGAPRFDVSVTDLAGNVGRDDSDVFTIIRDLIGYTPVTTAVQRTGRGGLIEARFPEQLQGSSTALDWRVRDGGSDLTVLSAQESVRDGRTIVTLEVVGLTDPNATPEVTYLERFGRLRGSDGVTPVATTPRLAVDGIAPALDVVRPPGGPLNAARVRLSGETDSTSRPNRILVFRTAADGSRVGGPVAQVTAGNNGTFALDVPLQRDRRNRFAVEVRDPAGNTGTDAAFSVVEDSTAPIVRITNPSGPGQIPRTVPLRWTTVDQHPALVDIFVRVNDEDWRLLARRAVDEGRFTWDVHDDIRDDDVLQFRVRAFDAAGNTGQGLRGGLQLGPLPAAPPPAQVGPPQTGGDGITAVATSERTIDVTFPSPVEASRGAAGFSVFHGPGVERVGGTGMTRTLVLNSDLGTTTPLVIYNGQGVSTLDGRPVEAFRIRAERGFAFAPAGLVGDSRGGTARLSWTDERNARGDLARYEVRRDGDLIAEVAATARAFSDSAAGNGARTYTVRAIDDRDRRSRDASVRVDPNAPNITPAGGGVLSPDGQLALVVPPGAVRGDHFGRFEPVETGGTAGYRAITGGYRLVVESAADRSQRLTQFERFSSLSFRPGGEALSGREPMRVMGLRLLEGDGRSEIATRTGRASAESGMLTVGDFALGEAIGKTTRVSNADPAIFGDRFATAAALSQTSFAGAGTVVIARADDYPDALAASTLAAQVGGPVLLSTTEQMPPVTVLELRRLGADRVVLAGGNAALGESVAAQAAGLGLAVERVSGPTRFETASRIAERVGAFEGRAFLATGEGFADALAGSAPASLLTRPILLTGRDVLPDSTLEGLRRTGITRLTVLGGDAAVSPAVANQLREEGFTLDRVAGPTRFETATQLAEALRPEGLVPVRPIAATGQGDGITSPDALAAGPIAGRFSAPLLLVPRDSLGQTVSGALGRASGLRAVVVAGGSAAVSDRTRADIDAAAR
jgi:putative cell wall-binding protein